ncbi:hypothetical protein [Haloarchaeobius sp. HME9146]|uniref:hypothetical protein n=1 Tax=Haloarchaeobius sp. HME9146 TaxID=2978732 RepID=UPI0021C23719|nr:hypothetical protein [Haloarchaeobius sp. HME9146]MCT9095136.1 hypothetical protein [Haloarchaeobius sp. HME9146]
MARGFRRTDEGKYVFTADGELVGRIERVEDGQALVDLGKGHPASRVRHAIEQNQGGKYVLEPTHVASFDGPDRLTLRAMRAPGSRQTL